MPPRDVALTLREASEIDDRVRAGTATAEERALNEQCQARFEANPGCQKLRKQMVKYMTDPEVQSGYQRWAQLPLQERRRYAHWTPVQLHRYLRPQSVRCLSRSPRRSARATGSRRAPRRGPPRRSDDGDPEHVVLAAGDAR